MKKANLEEVFIELTETADGETPPPETTESIATEIAGENGESEVIDQ